ncbi:MAG: nucleotidyltransferase family protein [Ruminococcus sp.]|nr:nucleotidyltransferase family protein [Ruminococcus sp.]
MINEIQASLLDIVRYRLFGGDKPKLDNVNLMKLLREAQAQTVYNTVFPFVEERLKLRAPERYEAFNERYLAKLIVNTGNYHDHSELDRVLTKEKIPYAVIKGINSAYYYPDSALRDMGDVDFLVSEGDFESAEAAIKELGFKHNHGESGDTHIAYDRPGLSIMEMHRTVNGVPETKAGELIQAEIDTTIATARRIEFASVSCMTADDFHHGLIMLLHTASHMTKEGIGLRHLCDWAVFVNSFTDKEFTDMFESKLKSFGLWRFCGILTKTCELYLGIDKKEFTSEINISGDLAKRVLVDILSGGNFGKKDSNRYREIKYISDRNDKTVSERGIASQLLSSVNAKVKDNKLVKKSKLFYPAGLALESGKYIGLLLTGKRKNTGTAEMLKEASERKSLYNDLELFKKG